MDIGGNGSGLGGVVRHRKQAQLAGQYDQHPDRVQGRIKDKGGMEIFKGTTPTL